MLIDAHAHFYHPASSQPDWKALNASRLRAGERMGISVHVASILGSWGRTSPTYFPSPADLTLANAALRDLERQHPERIRGYVTVNPNFTAHAMDEIDVGLAEGMVGIKLAASRRANDPLLDPICERARAHGVPILHHIWQHRRREWPNQEASDAVELCALAARHTEVHFILAHIGGGGDWRHSLRAVREQPNVLVDLSGSGVDSGMLEACVDAVGAERLLFGCDLTMDTGWAKLRYLEAKLSQLAIESIRWKTATRVFPRGAFPPPRSRPHDCRRQRLCRRLSLPPVERHTGRSAPGHGPGGDRRGLGVAPAEPVVVGPHGRARRLLRPPRGE